MLLNLTALLIWFSKMRWIIALSARTEGGAIGRNDQLKLQTPARSLSHRLANGPFNHIAQRKNNWLRLFIGLQLGVIQNVIDQIRQHIIGRQKRPAHCLASQPCRRCRRAISLVQEWRSSIRKTRKLSTVRTVPVWNNRRCIMRAHIRALIRSALSHGFLSGFETSP